MKWSGGVRHSGGFIQVGVMRSDEVLGLVWMVWLVGGDVKLSDKVVGFGQACVVRSEKVVDLVEVVA